MKDASYAEARSYPLNVVGAPLIRFYADHGKIDFVDMSTDYRDYLTKGGLKFPGSEVGISDGFRSELWRLENRVVVKKPALQPALGVVSMKGRGGPLSPSTAEQSAAKHSQAEQS